MRGTQGPNAKILVVTSFCRIVSDPTLGDRRALVIISDNCMRIYRCLY
jgi:hypothetical protein